LQRISKASWSAWKEIEGLTPQARLFIWERLESFRMYVMVVVFAYTCLSHVVHSLTLDIRLAIRTNAIDENKADLFCNGLNALSLDIMVEYLLFLYSTPVSHAQYGRETQREALSVAPTQLAVLVSRASWIS